MSSTRLDHQEPSRSAAEKSWWIGNCTFTWTIMSVASLMPYGHTDTAPCYCEIEICEIPWQKFSRKEIQVNSFISCKFFILIPVLILTTEQTRKHSSRMRTTRLPTIHASVLPPDVSTGVASSSEQIWKDLQWWPSDVTIGGRARARGSHVWCLWGGAGSGPCTVRSNASWGPPMDKLTDWWTDTHENITFPQLRWQAVMTWPLMGGGGTVGEL